MPPPPGESLQSEGATPLGVALGVFALQLPPSAWWLSRYRYGPLEWLLRAFTSIEWPRSRAATQSAR